MTHSPPLKKIAILVIASRSQAVYEHYIRTYWTELIRYTRAHKHHIDVYLLFEHGSDLAGLSHLKDNIIVDINANPDQRCSPQFHNSMIPGVLSKTVYAFEVLQDRYDVFFRTNLSSIIRIPVFDQFVQSSSNLVYSGAFVWADALRADLLAHNRVGPDKSIKSLTELDDYDGNTFISGSGFFLSAAEAKSLVLRKHQIRYDIIDDVSIGLMYSEYEVLHGFTIIVTPDLSVSEMKRRVRASNAGHIRVQYFPLNKARALWEDIRYGQLWKVANDRDVVAPRYKIHFPLFDHIESSSNEVRLIHEGLAAHPRVILVEDPESADYLILCQNHLLAHCPFQSHFRAMKDKYKHKTIMLDYDDNPHYVLDADDFSWKLYFKRSCVDRLAVQAIDYGDLPVLPTAYCVLDDMVEPPAGSSGSRDIAISCLFEDSVIDDPVFRRARGQLLTLARKLERKFDLPMQIGVVSKPSSVGRSRIDTRYKECLYNSKIVLHANPDHWEGDARTWEAVCSGALVFVDGMAQPLEHPLVDGEHVIFYDISDTGLIELERKVNYYLHHDQEREQIGRQGREFVLTWHRSINRVNSIISELDELGELEDILEIESRRQYLD